MSKPNDRFFLSSLRDADRRRLCFVPPDARAREYLRRGVKRGSVVRPFRGMYAATSLWNSLKPFQQSLRVLRTLQVMHPEWTFCSSSAALAFGLPVSHDDLSCVHIVSQGGHGGAFGDVRRHRIPAEDAVVVQGIRVTPLERTAFDYMRESSFGQALAVADAALRMSGLSSSQLAAQFRLFGCHRHGGKRAIRTAHYADKWSESGGESIARAAMIANGIAVPELQVPLVDPLNPRRTFRVDYLWTTADGTSVIGEFDGMQKYDDGSFSAGHSGARELARERHREAALSLYGMPIARFSYRDVMDSERFTSLLKRYGIPQSDEIARAEKRLADSNSTTAQIFMVI